MKKIVCELCGSQDVKKEGELFICQGCGTSYGLEDAKKLLVEVEETEVRQTEVKQANNSGDLSNLYELARRAFNDANYPAAAKYYEEITVKSPSDWEANFY